MITAALILSAGLAVGQNAAQDRAAEQAARQALDDALQQQRREREAAYVADRKSLLASDYFLSERLYWTQILAVESLPEAERAKAKEDAEALILALSAARGALAGRWSDSAPTEAAQALRDAGRRADGLARAAAGAPALAARAGWISKSTDEVRKGLPASQRDWDALGAQTRCYALARSVRSKARGEPDSAFRVDLSSAFVYASGALPAIGLERFSWSAGKRVETLSLSDLSMDAATLKARVELQKSQPGKSRAALVWSKKEAYPLDKPVSFDRSFEGRDFRVTLLEKEAAPDVCHLTRASAEALFDLPAD